MSKKRLELPDYRRRLSEGAAVRRTIENIIRQSWKTDEKTAANEFERALKGGEFQEIKIGLSGEVTAYKLKKA